MSGDYSRWSFDHERHFAAVLMQQGRVFTDADWNEWVTIALRRVQAGTLDTIGEAAVPRQTPDGFLVAVANGTFSIGPGRIYVDGLLVENDGEAPPEWDPRLAELRGTYPTPYDGQPGYPGPPELPAGGPHLVYLKVWPREVTHIEDQDLVEKALGVDTTTRLQTVWQAKVLADVGEAVTCATPLEDVPGFLDAEPPAAGRLSAEAAEVPGQPDPCLVPPSGGYKGLENQLYRVQIHRGGDLGGAGSATFKWSRDNATVAARVTAIPTLDEIVVDRIGRDDLLRFSDGDWVEITDDGRELAGRPGVMRRIQVGGGVDDATGQIHLTEPLPAGTFPVDGQGHTSPKRNTRVRRWDQHGRVLDTDGNLLVDLDGAGADGTIPLPAAPTRVLLEQGVTVTFHLKPATGKFRTGDHWVIPARTADASVEMLDHEPPVGIHAHYAKLALVTFPDAATDCRTLWPPPAGEGGCDCTVCVSEESHTSGALTIQAAVEQVKEVGGTVCLGVGTYRLAEAVRVHDANSVRIRGQGSATVLVPINGGTALDVRRCHGLTIESLAVVTSSTGTADALRLDQCVEAEVKGCLVLNQAVGDGQGAAIGLYDYFLESRIENCQLQGYTGVAGGIGEAFLITASLYVRHNRFDCKRRGIHFGRRSVHFAGTQIVANVIRGCDDACVVAEGDSDAGTGTFDVSVNYISGLGEGIRIAVGGVWLHDNDIRGERDAIILAGGAHPGGIEHCQVLANRIQSVGRHGIAIRTHIGSGMIKLNILAECGLGGIVMEDDGSADHLVVENNQLLDIAQQANLPEVNASAMRFVAVQHLDVAGNTISRFALDARQAASRVAIQAVGTNSACIEANRLSAIAPAQGFAGLSSGIEVIVPFQSASVTSNTVRRGAGDGGLSSGAWVGIHVHGVDGRPVGRQPGQFLAVGDLAVASLREGAVLFTSTAAHAFGTALPGEVALRGNEVTVERSEYPPVILVARGCQVTDNRINSVDDGNASFITCSAPAVVSGNVFRGSSDLDVLEVRLLGLDRSKAAILGNVTTGRILVDGEPLSPPWAALNPISQV